MLGCSHKLNHMKKKIERGLFSSEVVRGRRMGREWKKKDNKHGLLRRCASWKNAMLGM